MRNRIYLFGRDDALLGKNKRLINPHSICNFIKQIDEAPAHHWAIISPAGNELAEDEGYKAISKELRRGNNYVLKKTPAYVTFNGRRSLAARTVACSLSVITINGELSRKARRNEITEAEVQQENVRAAMLHLLTADVKFSHVQDVDKNITIMIPKKARFTLQLGNTSIIIDAETFYEHREDFENGAYRLFHVLEALDQAELYVEVSDALKELGIIAIASPAKYKQVQPADVIFVDAKIANCELIRNAGFTAIDADTEAAPDHKTAEEHGTYLAKFVNHTPIPAPPDTRTYFQKNPYARDLIIGFCVGLVVVGAAALTFFTAGIAFPPLMICMAAGIFTPMWITVFAVAIGGISRGISNWLSKKNAAAAAANENPDALVWRGADEDCQRLYTLANLHKVFSISADADKLSVESEEPESRSEREEVTEEEMENSVEMDETEVLEEEIENSVEMDETEASEVNLQDDVSMTETSESAEEVEQEVSLVQRRFG
jgi:hypothetical protein